MKDYIRRTFKFIFYLVFIFAIVLIFIPMITGSKPEFTFSEALQNRRMLLLIVLFLAYSLVYPLIGFTKIKRYLNGSFNDNREVFDKTFDILHYEKALDTPEKIVYRRKSKFTRFAQWYEDAVVIMPNENPVIISGLRKSVTRIDRMIDQQLTRQ